MKQHFYVNNKAWPSEITSMELAHFTQSRLGIKEQATYSLYIKTTSTQIYDKKIQ